MPITPRIPSGNRVDLQEPYAVTFARQSVKNSLQSLGEEVIVMLAYHAGRDDGKVPRCPVCYNDAYEGASRQSCTHCYGTTFANGIIAAYRTWGVFTDATNNLAQSKYGEYVPIYRQFQTEWFTPDLYEDDWVVRVAKDGWDTDHRVLAVEGIYGLQQVQSESVRTTGWQPGQILEDAVGNRAACDRVDESHPIYKYPLVGSVFDRFDGRLF